MVGYKCKFCVEVHPTLRAICNHLRKHVQYGSVPAVSAVKVSAGKAWMRVLCVSRARYSFTPLLKAAPERAARSARIPECCRRRSGLF